MLGVATPDSGRPSSRSRTSSSESASKDEHHGPLPEQVPPVTSLPCALRGMRASTEGRMASRTIVASRSTGSCRVGLWFYVHRHEVERHLATHDNGTTSAAASFVRLTLIHRSAWKENPEARQGRRRAEQLRASDERSLTWSPSEHPTLFTQVPSRRILRNRVLGSAVPASNAQLTAEITLATATTRLMLEGAAGPMAQQATSQKENEQRRRTEIAGRGHTKSLGRRLVSLGL
jgi:hypothetical protein